MGGAAVGGGRWAVGGGRWALGGGGPVLKCMRTDLLATSRLLHHFDRWRRLDTALVVGGEGQSLCEYL